MSESARKEFRELAAIIRRRGYKVAPGGKGKHFQILDKKGHKVIDDHGPVIMSSTPGDFRARDLLAARLIRAGVLTEDDLPWKPTAKKDGLLLDERPQDDAKVRAALKQKSEARSRHERTQTIRSRLEPLVSRLGGWTKRGMQTEMAQVVYNYNKGAPHGFASKQAAQSNVQNLKKGGTLSENAAICWEAVLDDLEQADVMRERWFDLVRDARGLPSRTVPAVAYKAPSVVEEGEGSEGLQKARVILSPETGALRHAQERRWGTGERYSDDEHPVLEFHRNGGVRFNVGFTVDDVAEMMRAIGFFEGLAVQLSVFEGQHLVEPALEKIRDIVERINEARLDELKARNS